MSWSSKAAKQQNATKKEQATTNQLKTAEQQQGSGVNTDEKVTASPAATPPPSSVPLSLITRTKSDGMVFRKANSTFAETPTPLSATVSGQFGDCASVVSPCNEYIAFADEKNVHVYSTASGTAVTTVDAPRCINLMWSPKSTFLVCYAHHDAHGNKDGASSNLTVARILSPAGTRNNNNTNTNAKTTTAATTDDTNVVLRCGQAFWPAILWSQDESFAVRRSQQSVVCIKGDFAEAANAPPLSRMQIHLPNAVGKESLLSVPTNIAMSSGNNSPRPVAPPFLACFVPQVKQSVASIHVFRMPELGTALLTRPFGRGDRCSAARFSPSGNYLTVAVQCDDDKTGASYYGSTVLHLVDVASRSSQQIALSTGEGVHDVQWSPVADEFILVHGVMPRNRASLFSCKGELLYKFAESPRNCVMWAPSGFAFVMGGTGSLAGDFQFYDRFAVGKNGDGHLGSLCDKTSSQFFLPDSRHFATCNFFTTLRVDNKVTVWKYTGEKVFEEKFSGPLFSFHSVVRSTADETSSSAVVLKKIWQRPYNSPVKDQTKVQAKVEAWRPKHQSVAAAAALALPNSSGSAPKPVSTAPVGAVVAAPAKKKGGRR